MKTYRVYEAYKNIVGGIDSVLNEWDYLAAKSAEDAAIRYWNDIKHTDIDENTVIVATDDDGDSAHFYPKDREIK